MIKKLLQSVCILLPCTTCFGQGSSPQKDPSLTVFVGGVNYRKTDPVLALGVGFTNGISQKLDYTLAVTGASIRYPLRHEDRPSEEKMLILLTGTVKWKLYPEKAAFNPYVFSGSTLSYYNGKMGLQAPLGAGCQLKLSQGILLFSDLHYNIPLTQQVTGSYQYMLGLCGSFLSQKKRLPTKQVTTFVSKSAEVMAEKDSDGDGIFDSMDDCPLVPGTIELKGCPLVDSDGDGIIDKKDKCPDTPGDPRFDGCPIPDSDNDGLDDMQDDCPFQPGPVNNKGCPGGLSDSLQLQLNTLARSVNFATGSAILTPAAQLSLDTVALILRETNWEIMIEGHTDNQGNSRANLLLSKDRADAVKKYLVKRNIDGGRLTTQGFGDTKPVTSNGTVSGKAANRRVLLIVLPK